MPSQSAFADDFSDRAEATEPAQRTAPVHQVPASEFSCIVRLSDSEVQQAAKVLHALRQRGRYGRELTVANVDAAHECANEPTTYQIQRERLCEPDT